MTALAVVETPALLKLDLAAGQSVREGFQGVDIFDGADIVHDLTMTPWPWADESCEELHCSHFLEHLDGPQQIAFMNEACRILIKGGKLTVIVPYWNSQRQWQDPTHKSPFPESKGLYFNQGWREQNKLTHGPYAAITADFDFSYGYNVSDQRFHLSTPEAQQFQMRYYVGVADDVHFTFTKR